MITMTTAAIDDDNDDEDDNCYGDNDDDEFIRECWASHPHKIRLRSCPKLKLSIAILIST